MSRKKDKGINPELEEAISKSLKEVMADTTASITEKMKVIDRALKLEAIKLKLTDDEWGSGFATDEDEQYYPNTIVIRGYSWMLLLLSESHLLYWLAG